MLAYVTIGGKHDNNRADETASPVTMLINAALDPARYLKKIYNNLSYLEDTVGVFFLVVFILSCITPLAIRYREIDNLSRMFFTALYGFLPDGNFDGGRQCGEIYTNRLSTGFHAGWS